MVRERNNSSRSGKRRGLCGPAASHACSWDRTPRAPPGSEGQALQEGLPSNTLGTRDLAPDDQARLGPNRAQGGPHARVSGRAHARGRGGWLAGTTEAMPEHCTPRNAHGDFRARGDGQTQRRTGSPKRLIQPIPRAHLTLAGACLPPNSVSDVILSAAQQKASGRNPGALLQIRCNHQ